MNYKLYIIGLLAVILFSQASCSEKVIEQITPADDGIALSGMLTRADGDTYSGLYLKAVVAEAPQQIYIPETSITIPRLYESTAENITFPSGTPYYPLGNNDIQFYAYSNKLNAQGKMTLRAGKNLTNDAILSNQGYRYGNGLITDEGLGTPGSSISPAEILQFRHVMTKLVVNIVVDSTENQDIVSPPPSSIKFTLDSIFLNGTYDITNIAPVSGSESNAPVAENLSGNYEITEGVNYLIPTGSDLRKLAFKSLKIDDYTATQADLDALTVAHLTGNISAFLVSGYAYELTFKIRRLQVQAITLKMVDWDKEIITPDEIDYEPYVLNLELGNYINTGTDAITKVVMWTASGREYVGALNEKGDIGFVTLPDDVVDSVALYTDLGMLIAMPPDNYVYNAAGSTLTLSLSLGGMRLENPQALPADNNPYLISTPVQIFNMEKELTASYKQMNDIDVDRLNYSSGSPLGSLSVFEGNYDGNGFQIRNLIMTGSALLKRNEGTIKNLHIASGRINAHSETVAGSICAENAGTIVASINEARIVGADNIAGGICGINEPSGEIIACINTGNIEDGVTLGGICGYNQNKTSNTYIACINTGLMKKGTTNIGGIIGQSDNTTNVLIINSFWLVGTAAKVFGGAEFAIGGNSTIPTTNVSALSPERLRDDVSDVATDVEETLTLLNTALSGTVWGSDFEYILDQDITGSVWPIPTKKY